MSAAESEAYTTADPKAHIRPDGAEIVIVAHKHPPENGEQATWTATWHLAPDESGEEFGDVIGPLADPADNTSWSASWPSRRLALAAGHDAARAHLAGDASRPDWPGAILAGYDRDGEE